MGHSASAHLMFGYALGGDEPGWNVRDLGEDEVWLPSWAKHADDTTWYDPVEDMSTRITEYGVMDVEVTSTGNGDSFEHYWLIVVKLTAGINGSRVLLPMFSTAHATAKLDKALTAFGVKLKDNRPGWHLVAAYG